MCEALEDVMTLIVIDDNLQQNLKAATGTVEICDAQGNVLGNFTPLRSLIIAELEAEEPVDYKELARLADEGKFISSAELRAMLGF
jgi:hypothetical protein